MKDREMAEVCRRVPDPLVYNSSRLRLYVVDWCSDWYGL